MKPVLTLAWMILKPVKRAVSKPCLTLLGGLSQLRCLLLRLDIPTLTALMPAPPAPLSAAETKQPTTAPGTALDVPGFNARRDDTAHANCRSGYKRKIRSLTVVKTSVAFGLAVLCYAATAQAEGVRFSTQPEAVSEIPGGFSCDLAFDLSGFQGRRTAHAGVMIPLVIKGYPLLHLFAKDADGSEQFIAATCPNGGHGAAIFTLTDFLNGHLPCAKLALHVKEISCAGAAVELKKDRPVSLFVEAEDRPRYELSEVLLPIWAAQRMVNETILPVSVGGLPAAGRLLFVPSGNVTVRNYTLDITYQEAVDYVLDGNLIRLTEKSGIPFVTEEALHPDAPSEYQLAVSYEHDEPWTGPVPSDGSGKLAGTKKKLKAGQPLKIALLGDSISFGANASKSSPPYLPGWGELLIQGLRQKYRGRITFVNPSRGGANSGWGKTMTPNFIVPEKPDLFIIAFGMNDANGTSVEKYIANIKAMMNLVSASKADTEFILVASMLRNETWRPLTPMNGYLAALKTLETEHVAVADVWSVSEKILKRKRYCDISGPGFANHPNDFMVRVYAQVAGALLQ